MTIFEVIYNDFTTKKTVWSKRGDKVVRRSTDKISDFNINPKTHIAVTSNVSNKELKS